MSSSLWRRAALAAVLGCGVWSGLARAQELYPKVHPAAQELPPGVPAVDNSPSHSPIRDWLRHRRPLGCWASFNGYTCSSLKSECAFMFGSCRTFYAEPCLKGAPPSPLPPWADPGSPQPPAGAYPPPSRCGCP